jgi:hypothetical protein
MLQVLITISQKFYCREEACGYKKEKRVLEKMDKCPSYQNNGYLDARLRKIIIIYSPCCPAKVFSSFYKKERGMFSRSRSRIMLATIYIHLPPHIHTHAHLDLIV